MKKLIKIHWKENLIVLFLISGAGISTTIASLINAKVLESLIQFDWIHFKISVLQLILFQIFFLIFTYFQIKYINITIQKMANYLRFHLIERIAKMSPLEFNKHTVGSYTSWLMNDINQIEQVGFEKFYELLSAFINLLLSISTLLFIHWTVFLMVIIESFIIIQLPRLVSKKLNDMTMKITERNEQSTSKTTYLLSGYRTFYNFKNLFYLTEKIKYEFSLLAESKSRQAKFIALVAILGGIGNMIGQLSAFALSGYLALIKAIPIGMIWTVSTLSARVFNIVGNLSQNVAKMKSATPIIERINQFISEEPPEEEKLSTIEALEKEIQLENVSYSYNNQNFIFKNVTYHFLLNHKYAIVGESGSGKSTLLAMINGTIDNYQGSIFWDGIDIATFHKNSLLDFVIYIEQSPYILKGSIRENISLGDHFSDSEIEEALEIAGLSNFKETLDYLLEENGNNISGGQKQRIALARGLIRKKQIVLLDESTSALDKKTAFEIENSILNIPNLTVIMVSHNLTKSIEAQLDGVLNLSE